MTDRRRSGRVPAPADAAGVLGGEADFTRRLVLWAAESAVDAAAQDRARTRWMEATASESATVVGTMVTLAERGLAVSISSAATRLRGQIVGVGNDFVALHTETGEQFLVATDWIDALHAEPGAPAVVGDRPDLGGATLVGLLTGIAAERPDVLVRSRTGATTRGRLRSVGTDVLHLAIEGDPPAPVWIPVASIALVLVR